MRQQTMYTMLYINVDNYYYKADFSTRPHTTETWVVVIFILYKIIAVPNEKSMFC
jgi:hypothetical protein